ncbi:MAG: hypothetical protein Q9M91_04805 [Candidatus Dojkabacteria bacterium]|nr:hypothetical protein [Candidatus Dojkabacteria bacterium]MDQ7021128.1 hypothetical protein [Candidatus Dojkabacteria bacterium]
MPDPNEIEEDYNDDLNYDDGFEDGISLNPTFNSDKSDETIIRKREDTRSTLAIIYTLAIFSVFFLGTLIAVVDGLNRDVSIIDNLKEIIPLISGVFLGSLGFVLGYYFRKGEDDK